MRGVLLCVSALCLSLPLSAQAQPTTLPEATGQSYPIYESELARCLAISTRLTQIYSELNLQLVTSEASLTRLQSELDGLKIELAALKLSLASSETRCAELVISLEKAEVSLTNLTRSFDEYKAAAEAEARRRALEAALWRGGALAGAGAAAGALAADGDGALYGALAGAIGGAVWWIAEHWPPWK